MKRGFLVKQKRTTGKPAQKKDSKRSADSETVPPQDVISDIQILSFDLHPEKDDRLCSVRTDPLPPNATSINPSSLLCMRLPPSPIDAHGTSSCVLYSRTKKHVLTAPHFPRSPPQPDRPSPVYEIRKTKSKGMGMFATHPLNIGDLILVERPLLVIPLNTDLSALAPSRPEAVWGYMSDLKGTTGGALMEIPERMLEVAFGRMSKENQDAYMELANAHTNDGRTKLAAIWRTNKSVLNTLGRIGGEEDVYGAIMKDMSRINHSCRQNCASSFDVASFAYQLRASRPISRGEEIVYSYCFAGQSTADRQAELKPYGFSCTCLSCSPTPAQPSNDTIRTSIPSRVESFKQTYNFEAIKDPKVAKKGYDVALQLLHDMEQEGLDGEEWYRTVMDMHVHFCFSLAAGEGVNSKVESMRWMRVAARLGLAFDGSFKPHPWIPVKFSMPIS
ncbi:hypothetical protein BDQ17DRAFT_1384030 [Cyathus striatus]|nr:hypothetical protein BDQ17DRAFT_1384030 [Cyathus striatus]